MKESEDILFVCFQHYRIIIRIDQLSFTIVGKNFRFFFYFVRLKRSKSAIIVRFLLSAPVYFCCSIEILIWKVYRRFQYLLTKQRQGQVQSLYRTWSMTTSFYHDFITLTKVEIACVSNIVSLLVTLSTLKIYDVARPDL